MLDPVQRVAEQPDQEAHAELGDQLEDVAVDRDVHQRNRQEQLRNRQLGDAEKEDRDDGRYHHEQRVEDVVGGDHPRPFVLGGARLDQGVQRHYVEAAEQADAENRGQDPPGLAMTEQRQPVVGLRALGEAAGVPPEQHAEQAQAD
ncbi:hypothetical protein D3C85_1032090 [compost metagenome]